MLINENDDFISTIYFTVRDIFTTIKNMDVPGTTMKELYLGKQAAKVPRFDKIISDVKYIDSSTRSKSTSHANF